jgi:hypothetical protein
LPAPDEHQIFSFSESISANFQLTVRTFQALLFTAIIASLVVTVKKTPLTIGDVFSMALAFIPTGWGLLNVSLPQWWTSFDCTCDCKLKNSCLFLILQKGCWVSDLTLAWVPLWLCKLLKLEWVCCRLQ